MVIRSLREQLTRRRKWIAASVAATLTATVLTIVVTYWRSRAQQEQTLSVPQTLPTSVHQQLSGYSFTRSDEGRQIFTVHAARTVALKQGGTTVLQDVFVEVFGRNGDRRDVLRTRQCEYNAQSGDLFSAGRVELELNAKPEAFAGTRRGRPPVFLETSRVYFKQKGSLAVSDEPVKFRVGPARGSARGLAYATRNGWLELRKEVVVEFHSETVPPDELTMTRLLASHLRYDKESGQVSLGGPVEITQGTRRVVAERGTLHLNAQNRVTRAVLEGGVKAFDSSEQGSVESAAERILGEFDPTSGQLQTLVAEGNVAAESRRRGNMSRLTAQKFEMSFAGAHPQPRRGIASGNVRVSLDSSADAGTVQRPKTAGELSAEKKTLTASEVRYVLASDGRSMKEIETVGGGTLTLVPSDPKAGERVITAGQFVMAFDARSRLEMLRGLPPTRIIFRPPANAPPGTAPQESLAEKLEATVEPETQTIRQIEQIGNFRFLDGDRQASAERARYLSSAQLLTLIGQPQLWDVATRVRAERINFDLHTDTAEGLGSVQATHIESPAHPSLGSRAGVQGKARDPHPVTTDDPTNVVADRVVAARASQVVRYEGHVRVWRGFDVVESPALDVFRTERRVRSGSRVLTSHLQPAARVAGTGAGSATHAEARPVTIRADRLEYFDQGRKAAYRGNVELRTERTALRADRVDVYFRSAGGVEAAEVERAVGDGHVRVVQPTRSASGEHADYDTVAGKIVLTGGPPRIVDAEKGSTTGQRLTFFIHDDSLQVDGGEQSPTVSQHRVAQ